MRIGSGYDVHRLVIDRRLVLGGVEIPHRFGLLGHSDADVLCHAICDALLGALALGDIGQHFPDTDDKCADADSLELLAAVGQLINAQGWQVANLDSTIIAEQPKLAPYIKTMRENIAHALDIEPELASVKATTSEQIGFCGRQEGIAAQAVVLLTKIDLP